jgi:class 3 adenylate cyclase
MAVVVSVLNVFLAVAEPVARHCASVLCAVVNGFPAVPVFLFYIREVIAQPFTVLFACPLHAIADVLSLVSKPVSRKIPRVFSPGADCFLTILKTVAGVFDPLVRDAWMIVGVGKA